MIWHKTKRFKVFSASIFIFIFFCMDGGVQMLILVCRWLAVPHGTVKMTLTPIFVDLCLIFLAVNVVSGISRRKMLTIIQNAAIPAMISSVLSCDIMESHVGSMSMLHKVVLTRITKKAIMKATTPSRRRLRGRVDVVVTNVAWYLSTEMIAVCEADNTREVRPTNDRKLHRYFISTSNRTSSERIVIDVAPRKWKTNKGNKIL